MLRWIKFKECGVRGDKLLFVGSQNIEMYPEDLISDTLVIDGTITRVPNAQKNILEYAVR